jgi:hypothetical protein
VGETYVRIHIVQNSHPNFEGPRPLAILLFFPVLLFPGQRNLNRTRHLENLDAERFELVEFGQCPHEV